MNHYEESVILPKSAKEVFGYIDDHNKFSSHMNQSSLMMAGSKMKTTLDSGHGQKVGSHIRMKGSFFGIGLYLDEVITVYKPPLLKEWKIVGTPKLLVVGNYQMKVAIKPIKPGSHLTISIDYEYPKRNAWLGKLFGGWYAKWCVRQMLDGVKKGI